MASNDCAIKVALKGIFSLPTKYKSWLKATGNIKPTLYLSNAINAPLNSIHLPTHRDTAPCQNSTLENMKCPTLCLLFATLFSAPIKPPHHTPHQGLKDIWPWSNILPLDLNPWVRKQLTPWSRLLWSKGRRHVERPKVELLLGTKNQEPLAKPSHLQNYMLNLF